MESKCVEVLKSLLIADGKLEAGRGEINNSTFNDFVLRADVQLLTDKFVQEIKALFEEALKVNNPDNADEITEGDKQTEPIEEISNPATTRVFSTSGVKTIDSINIQNIEWNIQPNSNFPNNSADLAPAKTQQSHSIVTNPSVPAPASISMQSHPGKIPNANSPAPIQPIEKSRTTFSLSANGKVNIPFRAKVEGNSSNGRFVKIHDVTSLQDLGLLFDAETSELHGTPLQDGEFQLKIHFQFDSPLPSEPMLSGECNLIINPDPKTLWKNIKSDQMDIYWKEDEAYSKIVANDGLSIIAASKRGRSHAHVGSCRDDDFYLTHDSESGWKVITVADGAGGSKSSRKGSKIASIVATESIRNALCGERGKNLTSFIDDFKNNEKNINDELYYLFGNAAKEAVSAIGTESKAANAAFKDYSTTLLITIHKKIASGHFISVYWVGDGGVGVYRQGQEVKILGKADSGEFAGQTRFLDNAMLEPTEIVKRIKMTIVEDFSAIIAMTDGITDPKFETDANLENLAKWDELWLEMKPVLGSDSPDVALLDWLDFWSLGNHDDRTIAVVSPIISVEGSISEAIV